jgi:hypothetical protein
MDLLGRCAGCGALVGRDVGDDDPVFACEACVSRAEADAIGLREQLREAIKRTGDLRAHVQGILDAGYHYAEEYSWSLQEALDDTGGPAG